MLRLLELPFYKVSSAKKAAAREHEITMKKEGVACLKSLFLLEAGFLGSASRLLAGRLAGLALQRPDELVVAATRYLKEKEFESGLLALCFALSWPNEFRGFVVPFYTCTNKYRATQLLL